ncbi:MAG: glycine/betaine/sarcosine/D-proline family reductase selenoprotein B, partial [Bryobacteraceae bacterium]
DMLEAKLAGRPFASEIPYQAPEAVAPAALLADLSRAEIALVTTGGLVPKGNPDGQTSGNAQKYFRYPIDQLQALRSGEWEAYHVGYFTHLVDRNPNYVLPLGFHIVCCVLFKRRLFHRFMWPAYFEFVVDVSPVSESGGKHERVTASGPMLGYELVQARDANTSRSLSLLCLHGNSSHRGIWRPVAERLREFRSVLVDLRGFGDSDHVSPPAYDPEHHAADIAAIVAGGLIKPPYAILAHSAGALAAAYFIASMPAAPVVAAPEAFVWVDLDPLVPRWQVDYFHQGVASVSRIFATVEDAARPFGRIYPKIPDDRLQRVLGRGAPPSRGRVPHEARSRDLRDVGAR